MAYSNSIVYCWIIVRLEGSPPRLCRQNLGIIRLKAGKPSCSLYLDDDDDDDKVATTILLCTLRRNLKY